MITAAVIDLDPAATLARLLHDARVAAGYTSQDALARDLNVDRSVVTKAESGNRFPSDKVLLKWCELCGLDAGKVLAKVGQASKASGATPPWFETFREVVLIAHTIRTWHPIIVPGPLQVPDYAKALFAGMGEGTDGIEELVAARTDLQEILARPEPPALWAVMDEAVLRRQVGSDEVMHHQLTHLVEQGHRSHIGIQVVPAIRGANAGCVGAFTIATVEGAPDVLLREAVEDVSTDKPDVLRKAHAVFDRVRLDALSGPESLELIEKVVMECKP